MDKQPDDKSSYMRFAGAGLELAGSMLVPAAIGFAIDRYLVWSTPWSFLVGGVLGFTAGMYNFVRTANKHNH